jgi:hypothetical protein
MQWRADPEHDELPGTKLRGQIKGARGGKRGASKAQKNLKKANFLPKKL